MVRVKRSLSSPPSPQADDTTPFSDAGSPPTTLSPTKKAKVESSPSSAEKQKKNRKASENPRAYNPWTGDDRKALLEHIDALMKEQLWSRVKADEKMAARKQGGVLGHWTGIYKKLVKETEGKA